MYVWLKPVPGDAITAGGAARIDKVKLTVISPPWPHVGQEVNYLGRRYNVVKTSATKGVVLK